MGNFNNTNASVDRRDVYGDEQEDCEETGEVAAEISKNSDGNRKRMPIPLLLYHTGNMSMKNRIPMKKIQFLHNVSNLPPGTLVRDVFVKQCQHNIGLVAEFSPVLEGLELHDI